MSPRKASGHRPLPRPRPIEWVLGIAGIIAFFAGTGLASSTGVGWFWLLAIAGLVAEYFALERVTDARRDAIRARPPM